MKYHLSIWQRTGATGPYCNPLSGWHIEADSGFEAAKKLAVQLGIPDSDWMSPPGARSCKPRLVIRNETLENK